MTEKLTQKQVFPCAAAIIGNGPAGRLTALELARRGCKTMLIGPYGKGQPSRTTALMMPSVGFLRELGVWEALKPAAAPLCAMRIIDGTKRLFRSPAVEFRASEIGEFAFGYNIENQALNAVLEEAARKAPLITQTDSFAESYALHKDCVMVGLADGGSARAQLVAAADGRASKARDAAGITMKRRVYPQTALTLTFRHEFPHESTSTEFHTEEGPFTQVPLLGNMSALVWTVRPERARMLLGLGRAALAEQIAAKMGYMLGKIEIETMPESWAMGSISVSAYAARRIALVGETAHLFPPIGAQGLNLTIRDAQQLGRAVALNGGDAGAESVLAAYNKQRKPDIAFRTGIVHALNRALLSDFLPVQMLRSGGLELLRANPLLRGLFMREGMAPGIGLRHLLPPLLR